MINKKHLSRILGVIFTSTILVISTFNASAEVSKEPIVLTKSQSVDMALKSNSNLVRIDISMNTLVRNFEKYTKLRDEIRSLLDGFEDYKSEYITINSDEFKAKQKNITDALEEYNTLINQLESLREKLENYSLDSGKTKEEIESEISEVEMQLEDLDKASLDSKNDEINKQLAKFEEHKAIYRSMGLTNPATGSPIKLSKKDEYTRFVKARDIIWYSMQTALQKVKSQREVVNETIKVSVEGAYDEILFADEGLKLQKQLYDKQEKEYNNLLVQYENNQTSEVEKITAEKELQKLSLEIDKFNRQVENGKIQLKQIIGIDLEKEVALTDNSDITIKEPKAYDEYLSSALLNRNEIITAKLDYDEKERSFDIVKEYLDDDEYDWMDASRAYNEASIALLKSEKNIREDIENAYLDLRHKRAEIDLAAKKLELSKVQYNAIKTSHKNGMMSLTMVWNVEIGVNSAKINYINAIRDYKTALNKLDSASKVGPQY